MPRQDIAHYKIGSLLGAGGMGQVYLAQDLKLGRRVALKLLPPETSSNDEARKRLIREARAAATLDHPNICSVYEVGEDDGCNYIAMQYVEGETLDRLLKNGPLTIKEAMPIAIQIAEALAEAHSHGIVHRDIKPANIMIIKRSQVKVMDFGLAKTTSPSNSVDSQVQTETLMTTPGAIIGTVPYMSPEQVKGERVDARSDLFSFGVVVYEMLTGHQPFLGKTNAETISAILTREASHLENVPAELRRIVSKCLNKDREQRYQSTRDLVIDLNNLKRGNEASSPEAVRTKTDRSRLYLVGFIAASLCLIGVTIYLVASRWTNKSVTPSWSTAQTVATQLTNYGGTEGSAALSPDGRSFVFVSTHGGTPDIWLRQIAGGEPVRLTNDSEEEQGLVFAPDGEAIYFTRVEKSGSAIWRMAVLGGQARRIVGNANSPAPSPDGRSLAYYTLGSGGSGVELNVMSVDGSNVQALVKNIDRGVTVSSAAWSRDSQSITFVRAGLFAPSNLFLIELKTGKERQVTHFTLSGQGIGAQVWLPDNRHLLVAFTSEQASFQNDLEVLDIQDGSLSRLTMSTDQFFPMVSVSADGNRVLATAVQTQHELWKVPMGPNEEENGRNAVRLLDSAQDPMWTYVSRDGHTLLFNNAAIGSRNLWTMPLDGSAKPKQITAIPGYNVMHSSLSPDGLRVAFVCKTTGNSDIWVQNVDGSELRQLTNDAAADAWPAWTPNGEWIVFGSLVEGRWETKRIPATGGTSEKIVDGFFRGDLFTQPDEKNTWLVSWIGGTGGVKLLDLEKRKVIWEERFGRDGVSLPMFSPDGRLISVPRAESSDRDAIWVYETATGKSHLAARFAEPFRMFFRACWVDDGRAVVVNRYKTISHVVLLDRFWQKSAQ